MRAKKAEGAERSHGAGGVAGSARFDHFAAGGDRGLADGAKLISHACEFGDIDLDPPNVVVAGAENREGGLSVAAVDVEHDGPSLRSKNAPSEFREPRRTQRQRHWFQR
jgi:hypothetical protein